MKGLFGIMSLALYFAVGIICLAMAVKSISSKRYLPFHEEAAGKSWEELNSPLQSVIITILKISGLGFLTVGILLIFFPIVNYFHADPFIKYFIPVISLIYCFGLFLFNFDLFKKTRVKTPWAGSLITMFIILLSMMISAI